MGRRSHSRSLSIWTNSVRVGRWTIPARGEMELQYDPGWMGAAIGWPLSLSLPFNLQNLPLKGRKVANYFDNLLPDSDAIRRRVAERFSPGLQRPLPKCKPNCRRISQRVSAMPSWAGLSRRPKRSVRCRRKWAQSRVFQGNCKRARIHPDRWQGMKVSTPRKSRHQDSHGPWAQSRWCSDARVDARLWLPWLVPCTPPCSWPVGGVALRV